MATPKNDFGNLHLARLTFLEANKGASMPILADNLLAWLHTLKFLVQGVVGVAGTGADMPTAQSELTGETTATFWNFLEVRSFGY